MAKSLLLILFLIIMMGPTKSSAADPDVDRALRQVQKAIIQTAPVKKIRKKAERYLKETINPPAWTTTVIAVGHSATRGIVSTAKFKNLRLKGESWQLRPDFEYQFNGQVSGRINFNLDF